jgi:glycosyl transferase family 25
VLSTLRLMKWKPGEVLRFHPQTYSSNLRRAGLHHGAHAYGVSGAGAEKLLANQQPLAHIADQLFIHLVLKGELNAFVMEPKAFEQDHAAAFDPVPSFVNERPAQ